MTPTFHATMETDEAVEKGATRTALMFSGFLLLLLLRPGRIVRSRNEAGPMSAISEQKKGRQSRPMCNAVSCPQSSACGVQFRRDDQPFAARVLNFGVRYSAELSSEASCM